jgi:hypothetical protein
MGFKWYGGLNSGEPVIRKFRVKSGETIVEGMLCSLDTGEIDMAATNDSASGGVAVEGAAAGEWVHVITNPDAIYSVVDANARVAGATLDIATGAMGVAASSSVDFVVVAPSAATEPTLVVIASGEHYLR